MKYLTSILLFVSCIHLYSQGLKTEGKKIVNKEGTEVLLRGVGPGGWQVMEGYMMQTSGVAGAQHEIREKLIELMGEEKTETFFEAWRAQHFTQQDVDSLAAWGMNSIRIPMHYNLFTLPIEAEPVAGVNTWIETGFQLIDSVLKWCQPHDMYVILDLHAAPGGQGTGSEINDYDPDKPSLWESDENKTKTVALWKRIADRYKDEEWIGGYDLINEPHWNLPGGTALRALYEEITEAIRAVDTSHILFIEGNWYANDFTGLTPPWDDNMVYSFHKYWSFNNPNDLDWVLPLREENNIPLWMGESGENSNTWFTEAVTLFENNNIGWAWWTVRKIGDIDSPYAVDVNPGYQKVINYWKDTVNAPKPSQEEAFEAMMNLVENLKVENSRYRKDVPDALLRQPQTDETLPYVYHEIPGVIYTPNFDLGKNGFAYYDKQVADYNLSTGNFQAWNSGWSYRNDGVDIEKNTTDPENSLGFSIGFTEKGEWLNYTVNIKEAGVYEVDIRVATELTNGRLHLSVNNQSVSNSVLIERTDSWQTFETQTISEVILPAGEQVLTLHFDAGAINVGGMEFIRTGSVDEVKFQALTAAMGTDERSVIISLNKALSPENTGISVDDFEVVLEDETIDIVSVEDAISESDRQIVLHLDRYVFYTDELQLSYQGTDVLSASGDLLTSFNELPVINNLKPSVKIPHIIQAENYLYQEGFGTEETSDLGGGLNLGFSDVGDFADYRIFVRDSAAYEVSLRVAAQDRTGSLGLYLINTEGDEQEIAIFTIPITGGWQTWETLRKRAEIPAGIHTLRIKVLGSGFNLNWINIVSYLLSTPEIQNQQIKIYPNPSSDYIKIEGGTYDRYILYNQAGMKVKEGLLNPADSIDFTNTATGIFLLRLLDQKSGQEHVQRVMIK